MEELQTVNHTINYEQAALMVKDYKRFRSKLLKAGRTGGELAGAIPSLPICLTYNRDAILNLMKTPGCAAIRMSPGINSNKQFTLVIVGVDEKGENLLDRHFSGGGSGAKVVAKDLSTTVALLDEGQASPPYPPPGNDL